MKTGIGIEYLGGDLLGQTSDLTVALDAAAAGYGWFVSSDEVDLREIDLLSALTHEFGRVLGYDHDLMGDTLAVGERDVPFDDQAEGESLFDINPDAGVLLS